MKKLFLVAGTLLISGATFSQTLSSATSTTKYGLKAGVNLPTYRITSGDATYDTQSSVNFHVTGFADVPVGGSFSFQPGISLQGKGAKYTSKSKLLVDPDNKVTINTLAIEIPLNLVGKIPVGAGKLFLGAGPYIAATVAGNIKQQKNNDPETSTKMSFGNSSTDNQKVLDYGANFLGGYQFDTGLMLGGGYGFGLANLRPNGDSNNRTNNRVWSFSLGYMF
jgi:hypothetical protein